MKVKSVRVAKLPSFPDIDVDFPQSKRQELKEYLEWRWGSDKVCGIGTFSRLQPKGALADLSKVFGVPFEDSRKISKIIESVEIEEDSTLDWSEVIQEAGGDLALWADRYPKLFDKIAEFVGLTRQSSVHAAGKIISNVSLMGELPLRHKNGEWVSQFNDKDLEELGFVKYDILGIRHLDSLMNADEMVHGELDLDRFYKMTEEQLSDQNIWNPVGEGDTLGLFQLEADSQRNVTKQMKPKDHREVSTLLAINRPGVIRAGQLQPFLRRHEGSERPSFLHPMLEEHLSDTYGILVMQEQVLRIVQDIAGYSMVESDEIRRMIGKKDYDAMQREKPVFVKRALQNKKFVELCSGDPFVSAQDLWDSMQETGAYAFNAAHSQAYALLTSWGAYYKAKYPAEYITALMQTDPAKAPAYVRYARKNGYRILPPDINDSNDVFTLTEDGIRYGLGNVASVGPSATEDILRNRPFESFADFYEKTSGRGARRKNVVVNLISIGAFDKFGSREKVMQEYVDLYGKTVDIPNFKNFEVMSQIEMNLVGNYISHDPMEQYEDMIDDLCIARPEEVESKVKDQKFLIGGQISKVKKHITKKGDPMAFLGITWNDERFDVTVFPRAYEAYKVFLREGSPVIAEVVRLEKGCHLKDLVRLDLQ